MSTGIIHWPVPPWVVKLDDDTPDGDVGRIHKNVEVAAPTGWLYYQSPGQEYPEHVKYPLVRSMEMPCLVMIWLRKQTPDIVNAHFAGLCLRFVSR